MTAIMEINVRAHRITKKHMQRHKDVASAINIIYTVMQADNCAAKSGLGTKQKSFQSDKEVGLDRTTEDMIPTVRFKSSQKQTVPYHPLYLSLTLYIIIIIILSDFKFRSHNWQSPRTCFSSERVFKAHLCLCVSFLKLQHIECSPW